MIWLRQKIQHEKLPEQPEELVSNLLVLDGSLEEELDELTLEVRLVLESLHKLQQVLAQLRVTTAQHNARRFTNQQAPTTFKRRQNCQNITNNNK